MNFMGYDYGFEMVLRTADLERPRQMSRHPFFILFLSLVFGKKVHYFAPIEVITSGRVNVSWMSRLVSSTD